MPSPIKRIRYIYERQARCRDPRCPGILKYLGAAGEGKKYARCKVCSRKWVLKAIGEEIEQKVSGIVQRRVKPRRN